MRRIYVNGSLLFLGHVLRKHGLGNGKERWDEIEGASDTEVSGQLRRIMEGQSEPNRAHQGFREPTALAAHGCQRRRRQHGNLT